MCNKFIYLQGATVENLKVTSEKTVNQVSKIQQLDTQQVLSMAISFQEKEVLKVKNPICTQLLTALYKRFVSNIFVEKLEEFNSLKGQPVIYIANHQVAIESLLFLWAISGVSNINVKAIGKIEHSKNTWINEFMKQWSSYPNTKFSCSDVMFYFNRENQKSIYNILKKIKTQLGQQSCSLLIHVDGTRNLSCRQPVTNLGRIFIRLALEL